MLLGLLETPIGGQDGTIAGTVAAANVPASGFASSDPDASLTLSETRTSTSGWPRIEGYKLIGVLGKGGSGTVYKALQLRADRREVALKVLHGTGKVERERLAREAKSLGRLSHANIVTVYDVGDSPDGPYFTMEYLTGGSLAKVVQGNPLPSHEAIGILTALADGVAAAHTAGILHRDLKPSNVLLTKDGTPKIIDFGLAELACVAADDNTLENITPTGAVLGTPAYMAPEQASGRANEIDERTDVYGLGAVLYHCLTGRAPFSGETHAETTHRVLKTKVVPPRTLNREIDPELTAVCLKCLKKEKDQRYASVRDLKADLNRKANRERTIARPPTWKESFVDTLHIYSRTILISCLALVFISAVAAALIRKPKEDDSTRALRSLESELQSDRPVVLVDEKGVLKWSRWNTGAVPFADSPVHDEVLSFQALTLSRLELVPENLVPAEFIFEFEMRHDERQERGGDVGMYLNHHKWVEADPMQVMTLITVGMHDFPHRIVGPAGPLVNAISVHAWSVRERPGQFDLIMGSQLGGRAIQSPHPSQPRNWHRVRVEARRTGLKLSVYENGEWQSFSPQDISLNHFQTATESLNHLTFSDNRQPAFRGPLVWGPLGSIGVYVSNGQGSFKNVSIQRIAP